MNTVGNSVQIKSIGVQPPYMTFSTSTTGAISSISFVGFTHIPADILYVSTTASNTGSSIKSADFTNSPGLVSVGAYAFSGQPSMVTTGFPSTLKRVGDCAFFNCRKLDATLDGIESLGDSSFYRCTQLKITSLSNSITTIPSSCFGYCTSLVHLDLSNMALETMESGCFVYCSSLVDVDLPPTLTQISQTVFQRCTALTTVYCRATTPPTLANINAFGSCSALEHIYVPSASVDAYKTATNWSNYASIISAIPT